MLVDGRMFEFSYQEKGSVNLWLSGKAKNWGNNCWPELPDENIFIFIKLLNELPYLYTVGSCGGHVRSVGRRFFYQGNWITFVTDNGEESKQFLNEFKKLISECHAFFEVMDSGVCAVTLTTSSEESLSEKEAYYKTKIIQESLRKMSIFVKSYL